MPKDLRSYLKYVEEKLPGELVRIKKPVDPSWEVSAVIRKFQDENKFPAVLFENAKGYSMPIISNLFPSLLRTAATFETTIPNTVKEYVKRENNLLKPQLVATGPVKDVVQVGDNVDCSKLPIVTHCEKDPGPYITPGVGIVKDPDTGIYNAGIYRMMYKGPNKFFMIVVDHSHF